MKLRLINSGRRVIQRVLFNGFDFSEVPEGFPVNLLAKYLTSSPVPTKKKKEKQPEPIIAVSPEILEEPSSEGIDYEEDVPSINSEAIDKEPLNEKADSNIEEERIDNNEEEVKIEEKEINPLLVD